MLHLQLTMLLRCDGKTHVPYQAHNTQHSKSEHRRWQLLLTAASYGSSRWRPQHSTTDNNLDVDDDHDNDGDDDGNGNGDDDDKDDDNIMM